MYTALMNELPSKYVVVPGSVQPTIAPTQDVPFWMIRVGEGRMKGVELMFIANVSWVSQGIVYRVNGLSGSSDAEEAGIAASIIIMS